MKHYQTKENVKCMTKLDQLRAILTLDSKIKIFLIILIKEVLIKMKQIIFLGTSMIFFPTYLVDFQVQREI